MYIQNITLSCARHICTGNILCASECNLNMFLTFALLNGKVCVRANICPAPEL